MPIIQSRRKFLTGLATLVAAPAIVKVSSLMPVRSLPPYYGDVTGFYCPYIPLELNLEKIVVTAKSRQLSAEWTFEVDREISAEYGLV